MMIEIPDWSALELEFMRIGLAFTVLITYTTMGALRAGPGQPHPVGLARIVYVGWMGSKTVFTYTRFGVYLAMLLFVSDLAASYAVGFVALITLLNVTFAASQGAVNHGHHLLLVTLLAQAVARPFWSLTHDRDVSTDSLIGATADATAAWWSIQAIMAVYLTSAIAKLVNSDGHWIKNSPGLLMDVRSRQDTWAQLSAKTATSINRSRRINSFLLGHVRLAQLMFAAGLLIELSAPIGLLGEGALLVIGLAIIALHFSNGLLLGLPFLSYQLLVLTYFVNVVRPWR